MNMLLMDTVFSFIKFHAVFLLLFILVPRFVFMHEGEDITKSIMAGFVKMVFWIVAIGYVLVMLRLFEALVMVLIIITSCLYLSYKKMVLKGEVDRDIKEEVELLLIDHVDKVDSIEHKIRIWAEQKIDSLQHILALYFGRKYIFLHLTLLLALFSYIGYLRYHEIFINIAPLKIDFATSMLYMKFIKMRLLFHDNIYPQGFYIIMATIDKFALMDQVFLINFIGPMSNILTAIGMYFFLSRIAKQEYAGLLVVVLYGILGSAVHADQAFSANGLQFSLIFVLPVLYFFYEYINYGEYFFAAFLGAAAIGLIHPLAFVFLSIGLLALCIACIIRDAKDTFFSTLEIFVIMLMALIVSLFPLGIGLIMGKPFHAHAIEVLFATGEAAGFPILSSMDYAGIIALALLLLGLPFAIKNKQTFILQAWIFLFGAFALAAYLLVGRYTNSTYILSASRMLFVYLTPMIIAYALLYAIKLLGKMMSEAVAGYALCAIIAVGVIAYVPTSPRLLPRIERTSFIEQYLRISSTFRPTQWMIVSWEEGYPLTLGNGFHMNIGDLVQEYDPLEPQLVRYDDQEKKIGAEDVFIFYEKKVFVPDMDRSSEAYRKRLEEKWQLSQWIDKYVSAHENITSFYNDEDMQIWHIHNEPNKEELRERIWNN